MPNDSPDEQRASHPATALPDASAPSLTVFSSALTTTQRELVMHPHLTAPLARIYLHYGERWDHPVEAVGVTFPTSMPVPPVDHHLRGLWRSAKRDGQDFLLAIRDEVLSNDIRLVITVAHELEHARQEVAAPGILAVYGPVLEFIQETPALHATIVHQLQAPVDFHAEVAAVRSAANAVGWDRVREYYLASPVSDILPFAETSEVDQSTAAADLAKFILAHWSNLERWYRSVLRLPPRPPLSQLRTFAERHAPV